MTDAPPATDPGNEPIPADLRICNKHKTPCDVDTDCHVCHGDGEIEDMDDYGDDPGMETCYSCRGSGVGWPDCRFCLEEDEDDI